MNLATTGCDDDQGQGQDQQQDLQQQNLSEEESRKLLKPDPSWQNDILPIVLKYYSHVAVATATAAGDAATDNSNNVDIRLVKQLDSYDDCNFWITINGTNYLLKVHNGVESQDLLKYLDASENADDGQEDNNNNINKSVLWLQNEIMETLTKNEIGTNRPIEPKLSAGSASSSSASVSSSSSCSILPIPGVVANLPVVSREHSPTRLVVRLLGWVDGRPMSDFPMIPIEAIADAGKFLGQLSKVLSTKLQLPTDSPSSTAGGAAHQRYHQWDGKNTMDLKDFVQYVDDSQKRSMVESVINEFQSQLVDTNIAHTHFTKSLIHGDFNDANFLLDNNTFQVSGVIDFGDSVESWRILDLSVAMAYAMLTVYGKQNRMISAAAAFLRGYHSVCPISDIERQHLPLLIACRLSCSVTLGAYSYKQNPGNEYLLLHAVPGWNALELIWGTDPDRRAEMRTIIDEIFEQACLGAPKPSNNDDDDTSAAVIDCSDLAFPDPSVIDPFASIRSEASNKRPKTG